MVVGESRFFSVEAPSSVDISGYTARYELKKEGTVKKQGDLTNNGSGFDVKLQTDDLSPGTYDLRIFITDPLDGFVEVLRDSFVLEK